MLYRVIALGHIIHFILSRFDDKTNYIRTECVQSCEKILSKNPMIVQVEKKLCLSKQKVSY